MRYCHCMFLERLKNMTRNLSKDKIVWVRLELDTPQMQVWSVTVQTNTRGLNYICITLLTFNHKDCKPKNPSDSNFSNLFSLRPEMKKRPCAEVLALGSAQLKPCTAKRCNHSYKTLSFSSKVLCFCFLWN